MITCNYFVFSTRVEQYPPTTSASKINIDERFDHLTEDRRFKIAVQLMEILSPTHNNLVNVKRRINFSFLSSLPHRTSFQPINFPTLHAVHSYDDRPALLTAVVLWKTFNFELRTKTICLHSHRLLALDVLWYIAWESREETSYNMCCANKSWKNMLSGAFLVGWIYISSFAPSQSSSLDFHIVLSFSSLFS